MCVMPKPVSCDFCAVHWFVDLIPSLAQYDALLMIIFLHTSFLFLFIEFFFNVGAMLHKECAKLHKECAMLNITIDAVCVTVLVVITLFFMIIIIVIKIAFLYHMFYTHFMPKNFCWK